VLLTQHTGIFPPDEHSCLVRYITVRSKVTHLLRAHYPLTPLHNTLIVYTLNCSILILMSVHNQYLFILVSQTNPSYFPLLILT